MWTLERIHENYHINADGTGNYRNVHVASGRFMARKNGWHLDGTHRQLRHICFNRLEALLRMQLMCRWPRLVVASSSGVILLPQEMANEAVFSMEDAVRFLSQHPLGACHVAAYQLDLRSEDQRRGGYNGMWAARYREEEEEEEE